MSEHEKALYKFEITGIDCANCAAKLESKIAEIEGISNVSLSFMNHSLQYECDHDEGKRIEEEVRALAKKEEPDAVITSKGHKHLHGHHHEEHEHHHHECHDHECECGHEEEKALYKFEITGIDCANCAAKLESKIAEIEGISNVSLSFMNHSLQYECDHDEGKRIEEEVRALAKKEEPDAVITSKGHKHLHGHHHEEHEHHHHECHDHECECGHEEEKALYKFEITGIDCANCAAKLESKIAEIEGISNVSLSFMNNSLQYECNHDEGKRIEEAVRALAKKEEPDAVIESKGHQHLHEHHHEDHEDHEHHEHKETAETRKFTITGIDCADCAAHLEHKLQTVKGVRNLSISYINSLLVYDCDDADVNTVEEEIRRIAAEEEPDAVIEAYTRRKAAAVKEQEDDSEEKEEKLMLYRLIAGGILFIVSIFLSGTAQALCAIAAWLVLGYDILIKAVKGIGRGQIFDEHFLMAVATIAAIYLKDYREAAGVMLFYQIGEYFQDMAVKRSRRSIGELMDIRPDYAWVKEGNDFVQTDPEDVVTGEIIRVKPGERIPLDGVIVSGSSCLNTSSLTGESKRTDVDPGDEAISGAVNETGVLEIIVTKEYGDSTVARILELVENSDTNKASQEKFITKFSRWYTPLVVFSAVITAVIVALVSGDINEGIRRACTFLVISCPCALVISIPLSFFAGIGGLSGKGILVKGANVIETLANVKQVVLDKTGTLTTGEFYVDQVIGTDDKERTLRNAAYAEHFSNHPIARSVEKAYGKEIDDTEISDVKEIPGRGLSVRVSGNQILAGNYKLMNENGISCNEESVSGTLVYVAENGVYSGCLVLRDHIKDNAKDALKELRDASCRCYIVSGDRQDITEETGRQLGTDGVYAQCLPADKVEHIKKLRESGTTAFVGDGVNDAPVLAAADAGFAMGVLGSDAAIEAADVVIMDDSLKKIPLALRSASRILRIANQNIYGAIGIKLLILILGAFGIANMWMAIFADTGVAMICVMNSMRLLRVKEN